MNIFQLYLDSRDQLIADHSLSLRWDFGNLPLPEGSLVVVTAPTADMGLDYLRKIALDNVNNGRTVQCDFDSETPHLTSNKILNAIHGSTHWSYPQDFHLPGDLTFEARDDTNILLVQCHAIPDSLDHQLHDWKQQASEQRLTIVASFPTPVPDDWRAIPDAIINLVPSAGGIVTAWLNTKSGIGTKTNFAYWYQSWLGRFVQAEELITPMNLVHEQHDYWKSAIERSLAEEVLGFIDLNKSKVFGEYLSLDFLVQSELSVAGVECDAAISDVESVIEETLYAEVIVCLSQGSRQFRLALEGHIVVLLDAPNLVKIVAMDDLFRER